MKFLRNLFKKNRQAKATASGIKILLELCTRDDILYRDTMEKMFAEAIMHLRVGGDKSSKALAGLVIELLDSRSGKIGWALDAAQEVTPTPELLLAIQSVVSAPQLESVQVLLSLGIHGRFRPEIAGGGQIGWTDHTYELVKDKATRTLEILEKQIAV